MATILDQIIETKRAEVAHRQAHRPMSAVIAAAAEADPPRDFHAALSAPPPDAGVHIIAEIKRRSPSAGLIRADFDPAGIARIYERHGASALSVLTDEHYFDGRLAFIAAVKAAVRLPVLRKDFIIDAYQIYESRAAGADAILLIGEVLPPSKLVELLDITWQLGLASLIEVHESRTLANLLKLLPFPNDRRTLLGINNRDLKVQRTDLATTERLAGMVGPGTVLVSESGVKTRDDVDRLERAGARVLLVGETLMSAPDIGHALDTLLGRIDA